jgi:hypothetical protein
MLRGSPTLRRHFGPAHPHHTVRPEHDTAPRSPHNSHWATTCLLRWSGIASLLAKGRALLRAGAEAARDAIRNAQDRALVLALGALAILAMVIAWAMRYAIAINRLTRGVGDTVFLTADGQPWFRLDEHRRDVPLAEISGKAASAISSSSWRRARKS